MIEYISNEHYPDDQFIKESCVLTVDGKQRFCYVRRANKEGGLFWGPMTAYALFEGQKKKITATEWDSNFLAKDILAFLDNRLWENKPKIAMTGNAFTDNYKQSPPTKQSEYVEEGLPF